PVCRIVWVGLDVKQTALPMYVGLRKPFELFVGISIIFEYQNCSFPFGHQQLVIREPSHAPWVIEFRIKCIHVEGAFFRRYGCSGSVGCAMAVTIACTA